MRWLLISVGFLLGCPRPPTPPPPPPPLAVPEGCLADLSGHYLHAQDEAFAYEVRDDGGSLVVTATHHLPEDAGFRPRLFGGDGGFRVLRRDGGPGGGGPEEATAVHGSSALDAGPGPTAAPVAQLTFTRTPQGFTGEAVTTLTHPGGRSCEAHFAAEVLSCNDGGLVLAVEPSTALGDSCQSPAHPAQDRVRHRLLKAEPPRGLSPPSR